MERPGAPRTTGGGHQGGGVAVAVLDAGQSFTQIVTGPAAGVPGAGSWAVTR